MVQSQQLPPPGSHFSAHPQNTRSLLCGGRLLHTEGVRALRRLQLVNGSYGGELGNLSLVIFADSL